MSLFTKLKIRINNKNRKMKMSFKLNAKNIVKLCDIYLNFI